MIQHGCLYVAEYGFKYYSGRTWYMFKYYHFENLDDFDEDIRIIIILLDDSTLTCKELNDEPNVSYSILYYYLC